MKKFEWDKIAYFVEWLLLLPFQVNFNQHYLYIFFNQYESTGNVALVVITGTAILVPNLEVMSLQLIWRSGTRRFHLCVPSLQMSYRDLTTWQGTRIVASAMAARWQAPLYWYPTIVCKPLQLTWRSGAWRTLSSSKLQWFEDHDRVPVW